MKKFKEMTVGEIVADNFKYAQVFNHYKIDFCCNGSIPFTKACENAKADINEVIMELETVTPETSSATNFKDWPTDLLADYILKFHHRNIQTQGPEISELLDKVCHAHGNNHPELYEVQHLFAQSLADLYNHLQKEEMVLFPYIYELCDAKSSGTQAPHFHCGSIESPIAVMMSEHDAEGNRYRQISALTNEYTAPKDACNSYRLVLDKLRNFEMALHQHIHLENNIVFPRAIKLEDSLNS